MSYTKGTPVDPEVNNVKKSYIEKLLFFKFIIFKFFNFIYFIKKKEFDLKLNFFLSNFWKKIFLTI